MDKGAQNVRRRPWMRILGVLSPRQRFTLTLVSFLGPLFVWSAISYVPFIWHPMVRVADAGDSSWFSNGELVDGDAFAEENGRIRSVRGHLAAGTRANPVFLPPPHAVVRALITGFTTPPARPDEPWLHQALWHSITIIFWGFAVSSVVGVPLGILCGALPATARLTEPFIEFFRYLPAPAFGALAVAVLGINDAPKIAIIFVGTFFQQVLVISNTTRRIDPGLLEAAQTLGASRRALLFRVVVPGVITDVYTDMRVLLGWAWTYLIVAELIGVSSGITFFINQQAKYRAYDKVFASIVLIGLIGLGTDVCLARIGRRMFPWLPSAGVRRRLFFGLRKPASVSPAPATEVKQVASA
ncbi:MAG TPA: ABC transporter permease [Polyangia bacterium]|jgi:NitT/TauT family transport system permease protein